MFSAEQLLQPISADQPAGTDLTFSPDMDAIAHARKFDDPSLDQGEWLTELKEADWDFVVERCAGLLEGASKDLRLAVWLAEAATKRHGLAGLAEGLLVNAGLVERYWDQGLYPEAEDGDQEQRIGNLAWLLARIPALLREVPVTDGHGAWSLLDFDVARKANLDDGRKLAEMEAARRNSSGAFRAAFAQDAQACMDALLALERAVDRHLGNDAPAFVGARDAVQDLLRMMPAPGQPAPSAEDASAASAPQAGPAPVAEVQAGPPGAITSRAQAIAQLRLIADFFRRTEPHSPVSYFADKAASAGEQDLHTWLRTVVKDSASLAHIEELLGVQRQDG